MIKECTAEHLKQCVEIAFLRNNIPESNCAYCPLSKESITEDLEYLLNNPNSLLVGFFNNDILVGFLGCFVNPENNWGDCIGPFFKDEWNQSLA